eukprot:gene9342-11070_t
MSSPNHSSGLPDVSSPTRFSGPPDVLSSEPSSGPLDGPSSDCRSASASRSWHLWDLFAADQDVLVLVLVCLGPKARALLACTCATGLAASYHPFFLRNICFASCQKITEIDLRNAMGVAVSSMDISGCTRLRWDRVRTVLPEARLQRLDLRGGPSLELLTPEGATRVFNQLAAAAETISCSIGLDASHPHAHAAPNLPQHDELHAPLQAILLSPIPWFVDMLKALQSFSTDAEAVFEGCTLDLSDLAGGALVTYAKAPILFGRGTIPPSIEP